MVTSSGYEMGEPVLYYSYALLTVYYPRKLGTILSSDRLMLWVRHAGLDKYNLLYLNIDDDEYIAMKPLTPSGNRRRTASRSS